MFRTKKHFITCSKLIIKELGHCSARSDKFYFTDNKQASLVAITAALFLVHAWHNLIKLKVYNSWSAVTTVNNILENTMGNASKPIKFDDL